MQKFECLDIETIRRGTRLYVLSIAFTRGKKVYYNYSLSHEENILYFLKNATSQTYFVHNLTFDGLVMLESLLKFTVNFEWLCIKRWIFFIKFTFENKRIILKCTFKLLPFSLSQLASSLLNKKKLIFPYGILGENLKKIMIMERSYFKDNAEFIQFIREYGYRIDTEALIKKYNINDVIITKQIIQLFFKALKTINYCSKNRIVSIASISINFFFQQKTAVQKYLAQADDRVLREAYYGGRCEVFGNPFPDEQIVYYDYSGMYASCMKQEVPSGEFYYEYRPASTKRAGYYSIKFKSNLSIPVLPHKASKLFFLNGEQAGLF